MNKDVKVGLALSGGGTRAMAFHLGCLRALDDLGILGKVEVVSGVSGRKHSGRTPRCIAARFRNSTLGCKRY